MRDNEAKKPKAASSSNAPPADPRRGAPGNSKALPLVFPAASPQVKNAVGSFQTQLKGYAAARQDTAVPWSNKAKLPDRALAHVRTSVPTTASPRAPLQHVEDFAVMSTSARVRNLSFPAPRCRRRAQPRAVWDPTLQVGSKAASSKYKADSGTDGRFLL